MKDRYNNGVTGVPLLSFFTGGGFFDIGFEQAGFNIIWTNENNRAFARMYTYGMTRWRRSINPLAPKAKITTKQDIKTLPAHKIEKQAFSHGKPRFFGVIGGPPCPDFSTGGLNLGMNGLSGKLAGTYVQRIIALMPHFFVLENVAGLYRTKVHRTYLNKLIFELQEAGYCLDYDILNALEMGVPQDRERLIMIGVHQQVAINCNRFNMEKKDRKWFPWPKIVHYKDVKMNYNWPQITPFGTKPPYIDGIPYELTVDSAFKNLPVNNQYDQFKAYSKRFKTVEEGNTKRKSFKRLHRYRYSPTACYGNNEVHLHPSEARRISVREAMRIQGIPDEYVLPDDESLSAKFAIVSNGVPVPLAYQIAQSLKEFLFPAMQTPTDNYGYLEQAEEK